MASWLNSRTKCIRGNTQREVELKAVTYMSERVGNGELWEMGEVMYAPVRVHGYKPWAVTLHRVDSKEDV